MEGSVIPEPYAYPAMPHQRRHGPAGWNDYHRYRPWLRDEFSFRCVYCLERELWRDMRVAMHIDHFEPQSLHPELGCVYTNLLYLCPNCNSLKRASALPDPCVTALGKCLRVHTDGRIEAINADGRFIIEILALDHPTVIRRRRMIIGVILSSAASDWKTFVEWMGYPPDLPNLSEPRNIPPSNSKPEGVAVSHYEKRLRGELPEIY